ncbi:MAG: DUF2851 family protein [Candidatus Sumerlaeaceae bacterium]|nr:DUF2851 family protein [Candidatus Sumerlaeaceae bacterium]
MGLTYNSLRSQLAAELRHCRSHSRHAYVAHEPPGFQRRELLLQAAWHHGLIDVSKLETCSRRKVEIANPGRWNRQAGPDFTDACVIIAGIVFHGDVELHLRASDWDRHHHSRDFEYNNVILHAFLENDDNRVYDTLHNGRRIERLMLRDALAGDLDSLHEALEAEELPAATAWQKGLCQETLRQLDVAFVRNFIHAAARERMEQKIQRFLRWMASDTPDQALYQALLTMLGQKFSRPLLLLLARRTAIEELKAIFGSAAIPVCPLALESVLLHVSGLIQLPERAASCSEVVFDEETQYYLEELARWWSRLAGYYLDRVMTSSRRWHAGTRPVSFPERRLAGISRVLANLRFNHGLMSALVRQFRDSAARNPRTRREWHREIKLLATTFQPEDDGYWSRRYTLGGSPAARSLQLIGKACAQHLLFNAALPAVAAAARLDNDKALEEFLWQIFENFPALESNTVSRFMRDRILALVPTGTVDMQAEWMQQGLLHIFYDCCRGEAKGCEQCALLYGVTSNNA